MKGKEKLREPIHRAIHAMRKITMNRDKQTSCNLPAARCKSISEISSIEIHRSCVFINDIYLALPEILQLIRADKPNQMSRLAYQKLFLLSTAQNMSECSVIKPPFSILENSPSRSRRTPLNGAVASHWPGRIYGGDYWRKM